MGSPTALRRALFAAAFVCLAPSALGQDADVPGMLFPGERVKLTLEPEQTRSVSIGGLGGGRWTVSVRTVDGSKELPVLELADPSDAPVPLAVVAKGKKVTASSVPFPETGIWRALVTAGPVAGMAVELAVTAKLPKTPQPKGTHGEEDGHFAFDALPGCICDLDLRLGERGPLTADVLGPDGVQLASASSEKGKVKLRVVARRAGTHDVVVRSAPGTFRGTLRVSLPKHRKNVGMFDVESLPEVVSVTPGSTTNDRILRVTLRGHGFAEGQIFVMRRTGFAARNALILPDELGATADIDLEDMPSGDWQLAAASASSRTIPIPGEIFVTNRPVEFAFITPTAIVAGSDVPFTVRGGGFDADTALEILPPGGGAPLAVSNFLRVSSNHLIGKVSLPPLVTGPCDLRIREGTRTDRTFPAVTDGVGLADTSTKLAAFPGEPRCVSSAYDADKGRAVLAVELGNDALFLHLDAANRTLIRTLRVDGVRAPRVAHSFANQTWCITYVDPSGMEPVARARVLDDDFVNYRPGTFEVKSTTVDSLEPVARFSGGWTHVWTRNSMGLGGYVESRVTDKDGDASATSTVVHDAHQGSVWSRGRVAVRHDGTLLVAWASTEITPGAPIEYRTCTLFEDGSDRVHPPRVIGTVNTWDTILPIALASDGVSGNGCLVAEWFKDEADTVEVLTFDPAGVQPTVAVPFESGLADAGRNLSVAWHPSRLEFVCLARRDATTTRVLRVERSGAARPHPAVELHPGAPASVVPVGADFLLATGGVPVDETDFAFGLLRFR